MPINDLTPLDFTDPEVIETLNEQKRKFEQSRDKAATEENSSERALSSQLILLATVLITGNVVVLSDGGVLELLTIPQKALSLMGLLLLFSSLFTGILYCWKGFSSFKKWGDTEHGIITYIEDKQFATMADLKAYIKKTYADLIIHTPVRWLKAQIFFLLVSFAVYFTLITVVFFNFGLGDKLIQSLPSNIREPLCSSEPTSRQSQCLSVVRISATKSNDCARKPETK